MSTIPNPLVGLARLASTPIVPGFVLQNGTPTIFTYQVPNDGNPHLLQVVANLQVTVLEVGGLIHMQYTNAGNFGGGDDLFPGGQAAGTYIFSLTRLLQPGTVLTVQQTSALTAGAATAWIGMFGG